MHSNHIRSIILIMMYKNLVSRFHQSEIMCVCGFFKRWWRATTASKEKAGNNRGWQQMTRGDWGRQWATDNDRETGDRQRRNRGATEGDRLWHGESDNDRGSLPTIGATGDNRGQQEPTDEDGRQPGATEGDRRW